MKHIYLIIIAFFMFGLSVKAQSSSGIVGLSVYPNPVVDGRVYISSNNNTDKEILIYDLLGKKVLQTVISNKELNISNLNPGVYIIRISEENQSATRKLIVK